MSLRILFTGAAPAHFVCFKPVYERLSGVPGAEIFVSGIRHRSEESFLAGDDDSYRRFALPSRQVLSTEAVGDLEFDVMFAAHSRPSMPRRVQHSIQIFHGVSFLNRALRAEYNAFDHYFVIGPYMRRRLAEARWLPQGDERAIPIGFMKTDRLIDGTLQRETIQRRLGLTGSRPVLLYAPSGARKNYLEVMGEAVIERLTETGQYDLLIKLHDRWQNTGIDWIARLARFEDAHCRVLGEPDVIPSMVASDLLLSDASSAANEYALLDRPIVFLDTPELLERARMTGSSMLDLVTWGRRAGAIVAHPGQAAEVVRSSLEHRAGKSAIRRALAKDLFYNPGHATGAAMDWFSQSVLHGSLPTVS